jgi:hypothetical protein
LIAAWNRQRRLAARMRRFVLKDEELHEFGRIAAVGRASGLSLQLSSIVTSIY